MAQEADPPVPDTDAVDVRALFNVDALGNPADGQPPVDPAAQDIPAQDIPPPASSPVLVPELVAETPPVAITPAPATDVPPAATQIIREDGHVDVDVAPPPAATPPPMPLATPDPEKTWEGKGFAVLRALDKVTARTQSFDAQVGQVTRFGDLYIKVQACREPPPIFTSESAAFLQVWDVPLGHTASRWVFSGWMFASSPALSALDHPVYDVWVIDCKDANEPKAPKPPVAAPVPVNEPADDAAAPRD
ncbi:MAG: DUF2155 domain-containing protein [Pseudomonadota bacterium]